MRFLNSRRIILFFGLATVVIVALIAGISSYLNSPAFNARAREYIVRQIEQRTGATATLKTFGWSFWHERFRLDDLTLRGLEPAAEAPLAHFRRIDISLKFRTLLEKKIDLFELTFSEPEVHVIVNPDGTTNVPSPESRGRKPFDFAISIDNFNIIGGSALLNEQAVNIDFSVKKLAAILNYRQARQVLESHFRYDGLLDRTSESALPIPYTLAADVDYTRSTLVAQKIVLSSGASQVKLQGRVNQLLSRNISGRLEYTGNFRVPFLNYFFAKEKFGGKADVKGFLEFSAGHFLTRGNTASDAIDFEEWHATRLASEYAYQYPEKRLSFNKLRTGLLGGSVAGSVTVENLPGQAHVVLDLDYGNIDAASLASAYPWDPRYRIFSTLTGKLNGWFDGKFDRFELGGHADFASYAPPSSIDVIPLPLDGSADYQVRPRQARVSNADVRLYSTTVKGEGLIDPTMSDMKITMRSSNLKDVAFVYADLNGNGSFDGSVTGAIVKPVFDGEFALKDYTFRQWKIQQASGSARLDLAGEYATLRNVRLTQGESQVLINGSTALSGAHSNLQIESNRLTAQDVRSFVNRDFRGTFAGAVHITALSPAVMLEGDIRANDLSIASHLVGDVRGHIRYFEPVIDIDQLTVRQNDSTLTGNITFNRGNDALKFSASATSVNLQMFYPLGLPDTVQGVIRQASIQGDGTTSRPNIAGNGRIQNLSIHGEVFPQAQVELASKGSMLDAHVSAGKDVDLTAQIDTATKGYPFTAQAKFNQYPVERIAQLSEGTIRLTGNVDLSGLLTDRARLQGRGQIEAANLSLQGQELQTTKPFGVDFNSDRLTVSAVSLTGKGTRVDVAGTIAFTDRAPLNLDVNGQIDLAPFVPASSEWDASGTVALRNVHVTGTIQAPNLVGTARLNNINLGRRGFFTNLTNLNGDVSFDPGRVTLNGIQGQMGPGTVRADGTAQLERGTLQAMNIRIDANDVRFRYPEGLRTLVNAQLVLRGNSNSPLLEGNVQIQSLAYRSDFEEFLALVTEHNLNQSTSAAGRLRLAVHIEGSRNITIQNQLANVEARIDVDLKGTVDDPSLTGHVEASGGTLVFQGNRYTVTRGNIDFTDPLKVEPVVDIEAESEIRDYRVILTVGGRGDKLRLNMRSEPPLPELEIVSLIAGGRTREEIAARPGSAVPTSEQLFQSGAASILSDLLQQRVGNRLGLGTTTRVHVDPFLVGAENNPGARVTLSEQVTKELAITYSQDLSSNRQQLILIEYFVTPKTSILGSRDELGNFGLDIRLRKRIK